MHIEPIINQGSKLIRELDTWTIVTKDGLMNWIMFNLLGSRSAQFEHTMLVTEDDVQVLTWIKGVCEGR